MSKKAERLARLQGTTTYKDFRQGMASAGNRIWAAPDQDIAHALGVIRRGRADIGPEVLEAFYGSTQKYKDRIKESLRDRLKWTLSDPSKAEKSESIRRFAIELAASSLGGDPLTASQVRWVSDLLVCRPARLEEAYRAAMGLLLEDTQAALASFLKALREPKAEAT